MCALALTPPHWVRLRRRSRRSSMAHDSRCAILSVCHLTSCPSIAGRRLQNGATHKVRSDDGLGEQTPRPTSRRAASGPQQHEPHPPTAAVARGQSRRPTVGPAAPTQKRRQTDRPDSAPSHLSPRSDGQLSYLLHLHLLLLLCRQLHAAILEVSDRVSSQLEGLEDAPPEAVSYTHLTLPTICSV